MRYTDLWGGLMWCTLIIRTTSTVLLPDDALAYLIAEGTDLIVRRVHQLCESRRYDLALYLIANTLRAIHNRRLFAQPDVVVQLADLHLVLMFRLTASASWRTIVWSA